MVVGVLIFPIHQDIIISKIPLEIVAESSTGSQITQLLTAGDFMNCCPEKTCWHSFFFFLVGFASLQSGEKGNDFSSFTIW
jgi:hypothetical protein